MSRLPPMVAYTLARLVLFAVPFGLLVLVGIDPLWAVLIAFVLSSVVSIFALSRMRDRVSTGLVERRFRIKERMSARAAAEDAWDDAQRAARGDADAGS